MPLDLTRNADDVDLTQPEYDPLLTNLQANIIRSHGRDNARHLFIRFTGTPDAVRTWIRTIAAQVTTARDQLQQSVSARAARAAGRTFDGGLVTGFYLSAAGYRFLGLDAGKLPSAAFRKGMKDQGKYVVPNVFGPIDLKLRNRDPEPARWEPGFQGEIHAMVALADDEVDGNITRLLNRAEQIKQGLGNVGTIVHTQGGNVLRRAKEPIEHFGYRDGVSQPLFTADDLTAYDQQQGHPRQPGEWDPAAALALLLTPDPFARSPDSFGSFLVYRKLAQAVPAFKAREKALEQRMGYPEELAGGLIVGRFEDGTPVILRDSESDDPNPANGFMHSDDKKGVRCPRHAHIRKSNPRGTTPGTTLAKERERRIARRGIPYGRPHPSIECDWPEPREQDDRGLLFMCFQANIEHQFEFIQRVWIDNSDFPAGTLGFRDTGDDPLIGQDADEKQHWPKKWNDPDAGTEAINIESDVTLKGGEYLFAPSKSFLAGL